MKILTADEMRACDQATSEQFSVPSLTLMENAGQAVARFVLREFPHARHITVLCGKGNNGGDGFVAARALSQAGRKVKVLLLGFAADLKGDAAAMFEQMEIAPALAPDEAALASEQVSELLQHADLFLDAVVGTGFKPPLRGVAAALRNRINALTTPVIAVDIPSGWDSDSREYQVEGAYVAEPVSPSPPPNPPHVAANRPTGPPNLTTLGLTEPP